MEKLIKGGLNWLSYLYKLNFYLIWGGIGKGNQGGLINFSFSQAHYRKEKLKFDKN